MTLCRHLQHCEERLVVRGKDFHLNVDHVAKDPETVVFEPVVEID
jgi:hypothetical protein